MGCCVSSHNSSELQNPQHCSPGSDGKVLPPLPIEEETVKEVLSETPAPKPQPFVKLQEEKRIHIPKPAFQKIEEEKVKIEKQNPVVVVEEISEVSEICSGSESFSTITTITESRDESEVRQRLDSTTVKFPRNRSFSGDVGGRRDRVVGKSPVKRYEPSPGRLRSAPGSELGQKPTKPLGPRRDLGESSGRRSRSPATRVDGGPRSGPNMGRSPSSRKTRRSPSRVPAVPLDSSTKVDESCRQEKWPQTTESLENPLVSLECFIFL